MMAAPATGVSYWRLSSFYFLYFAFLGAMMPYWSLYLQAAGLDATAIGAVLAVMAGTRIVAPNVWGWLADRTGRRVLIIRAGAFAALLSFACLLLSRELLWIVLVIGVHTMFWNAILAQYETITLASMPDTPHRYGRVRVWGSVSFIVAVLLSGLLFDRVSIDYLPWLLLALLALIAAGSLWIREPARVERDHAPLAVPGLLRERAVIAFLAASFLLQFSHAPYYGFFSLFLEQHGYGRAAIGQFWSLGVIAEIGVFAFAHRLLARFSLRQILLASLLLAALRWLIIAFGARSVTLLVLAQCLHAASFGSFHAASIEFIRRYFGPVRQGQGQALYTALSFGLGGAIGALCSGLLWDLGSRLGFVAAAVAALAGWWIVQVAVRGPLVDAPGFAATGSIRNSGAV